MSLIAVAFFFFSSRRRHTRFKCDWSSDVCSSDLKLADLVEQYLHKGHQAYIEGSLFLDQWDDKNTGQKRSKLKLVLNDVQFLEPRADGATSDGGGPPARGMSAAPARRPEPSAGGYGEGPQPDD